MTGWRTCALVNSLEQRILVDGQFEGLANMDVVKRPGQVVHRQVVNRQLGILTIFFTGLGTCAFSRRNDREIDLARQVGVIVGLGRLVEVVISLLQFWLSPIVMRIGDEFNPRVMVIALDHKGAVTTLPTIFGQGSGPLQSPFVYDPLLNNERGRIG